MQQPSGAHRHEVVVRRLYEAINRGDSAAVAAAFTPDAVWHGGGRSVEGADAIAGLVNTLHEASGGTLRVELHDVLANDEHGVALQVTRAERDGRLLEDRVVYVFHLRRGLITEAWFSGDPRVQDAFWD
ncbi:MAG TPA: nuclear transport factor 2 family protein [Candidatus Deferrimicrobiaceae bacterium]|nr:nuclear transport factor 2 family protein [Candidatus Deferrimicrobiaceae bacterium]